MEDQELQALQELKAKLITRASELIEKLNKQEESGCQRTLPSISFPPDTNANCNAPRQESLSRSEEIKLCKATRKITGIKFQDIDKKWLQDNKYRYTCNLSSKAITFFMDVTVDVKNETDFEILDINCHFVNVKPCILMEVESWVQDITRMKNFSLLLTAISQYNDHSVCRFKILRGVESENIGTVEQCESKNGGILVHVHSPSDEKTVLLTFQWSILFFERTCHMENYFTINPTDDGTEFAEKNEKLLKAFCKLSIANGELEDLWQRLAAAVTEHENNRESSAKDKK